MLFQARYSVFYLSLALGLIFGACGRGGSPLPFLGESKEPEQPYRIKQNFELRNQDGASIKDQDLNNKVYVADFFFTHCPSICPKVKKEMLRVFQAYKGRPDFVMLSFSIDGKRDTVERLRWYADKLGLATPTWHLLTGDFDLMQRLALAHLLAATEDPEAPGGFDHSGSIALVDRQGRIRGLYNGLEPAKVDLLIKDIATLLNQTD